MLYGCYSSADDALCDAENILFYNVGASSLAGLGQTSIVFERRFQSESIHRHSMRYSIEPHTSHHWQPDQTVARWSIPMPLSPSGTPAVEVASIWYRVKQASIVRQAAMSEAVYGLTLLVVGPESKQFVLMPALKRLFDGVISGLHAYRGHRLDEVSRRLGVLLTSDVAKVRSLLAKEDGAVLGPREVLWPFRMGIQWNPADDHCVHGELRRVPGGNDWRLDCHIFTVRPNDEV